MKLKVICVLLVTFSLRTCWAENDPTNDTAGFGFELLLAKLDYLEYKFLELQVEVKEQGESLLHSQEKSKQAMMKQTGDILEQQKIFADHEAFKNSIFELRPRKHPADNSKLLTCLTKQKALAPAGSRQISSCLEEHSKTSGKYRLAVSNTTSIEVYCEQTLYGGGWIVIQNRFNGSVDFYRNWVDYMNGFGSLDGEFWLGLKNIHLLTSSKTHELLVHLEDFSGSSKYARFKQFAVGSENELYSLKVLEGYNGTVGDSLTRHKGHKFTTKDVDNDIYTTNCAHERFGGWWYADCADSNLNGLYENKEGMETMSWHKMTDAYKGLKVSKLMIREL